MAKKLNQACVLAINGGSSSIKFAMYQVGEALWEGRPHRPERDEHDAFRAGTGQAGVYADKYGEDFPEIRNWKWSNPERIRKSSQTPPGRWSPATKACWRWRRT
jgi:hypothetical protein